MSDPDARTLPAPARLPREVAAHPDAPTPIPRKSSLEELRASEEPWVVALDELEARLVVALASRDQRTGKTDLEQDARVAALAVELEALRTEVRGTREATGATKDAAEALDRRFSGLSSPRVVGAFVVLFELLRPWLSHALEALIGGGGGLRP